MKITNASCNHFEIASFKPISTYGNLLGFFPRYSNSTEKPSDWITRLKLVHNWVLTALSCLCLALEASTFFQERDFNFTVWVVCNMMGLVTIVASRFLIPVRLLNDGEFCSLWNELEFNEPNKCQNRRNKKLIFLMILWNFVILVLGSYLSRLMVPHRNYFENVVIMLNLPHLVFYFSFLVLVKITFCDYVTGGYTQLHGEIESSKCDEEEDLGERFRHWMRVYNRLSRFVDLLNDHLGSISFLSCINGLFYGCSVGYMMTNSSLVSDRDESRLVIQAAEILFGVAILSLFLLLSRAGERLTKSATLPILALQNLDVTEMSIKNTLLIQQGILQLKRPPIQLGALGYFSVNNSFFITIVGIIVSYSILLAQLKSNYVDNGGLENSTVVLPSY